jgi:hypothetical protein
MGIESTWYQQSYREKKNQSKIFGSLKKGIRQQIHLGAGKAATGRQINGKPM